MLLSLSSENHPVKTGIEEQGCLALVTLFVCNSYTQFQKDVSRILARQSGRCV